MRKPNLFILGAPKCGTTSLAAYFAQHPDISVSEPKEPRYYLRDSKDRPPLDESEYSAIFGGNDEAKYWCDATPDYLASKIAIRAIAEECRGAKHIVMFRNYADMAVSLHRQEIYSGNETEADFARAWRLSSERRQGRNVSFLCLEPRKLDYQERIRVGEQLGFLQQHMDRDRVLLIDFDLLGTDMPRVWSVLLDFLGLSDNVPIDFRVHNPRKDVFAPSLVRLAKLLANVKRRMNIRTSFAVVDSLRAIAVRPAARPPAISEAVLAEISRSYAGDLELVRQFAKSGPSVLTDTFLTARAT